MKQMICGGCGCSRATIEVQEEGNCGLEFSAISLTCTECSSETVLRIKPAKIEIDQSATSGGKFHVQ